MPDTRMIKSVLSEYGLSWATNRLLYNIKLKGLELVPATEKLYEKNTAYPIRIDLFDIDISALQLFVRGLEEKERDYLITTADKACNGIIKGFSSLDLDYGNPIDWQLNPLTGERCDENQKWYRIPDFDYKRGDIKVVWEMSRFSHFVTLSRAYLLTNDKKYYAAFSLQLKEWLDNNPYGYGANYKCGQECSIRMINALLAYSVFSHAGIASDADASNVKDLVDRCYRKILSNFFYAYKCIKNNHTISELMGMIVGAWCCDDQKKMKEAYLLLDKVIDEQFSADGGYRQFSFNYQRLALQDLEVILSIEKKTGYKLSNHSKRKIRNSAWLMFQCQDESGDMPNYGNNDGSLVFPVSSCSFRDFSSVINTTYALITGKQILTSGIHEEELIWFSGWKTLQDYNMAVVDRQSSQFSDAGLFTIRGKNYWTMIVSNNYSSRPGHMDQHHIDFWKDGINVFCDLGTYSYASDEGRKFIRNESHNTALVEDVNQMNSYGPFMIYDWTKRKLGMIDGSTYEGQIVSKNGYFHKRIIKRRESSFEITDYCDKNFVVLFHTICDVKKSSVGYVLEYEGKKLCTISSNAEISLKKGMRSLYYLKEETINCLEIIAGGKKDIKTIIRFNEGE